MSIEFPVALKHTMHRAGGRIARIDRIGHETAKPRGGRSQDVWYFVGVVEWFDGSRSERIEIAPYSLCYEREEDRGEVDELGEALNEYLLEHGEWCDASTETYGWYAHRDKNSLALPAENFDNA